MYRSMMQVFVKGSAEALETYRRAFEVLKIGARVANPPEKCDYSACQCVLTDRFGVTWCLFE